MANIHYNSITNEALEALSAWTIAFKAWKTTRKNRDNEIDALGAEADEDSIAIIRENYKGDIKADRAKMRKAAKYIPDGLYAAYVVAVDKMDVTATGHAVSGNKSYETKKGLSALVKEFLDNIGVKGGSAPKIAALASAIIMSIGTGNDDENFIKAVGESRFNEKFVRAFLKAGLLTYKGFVEAEDGTITRAPKAEKAETEKAVA